MKEKATNNGSSIYYPIDNGRTNNTLFNNYFTTSG